MRMIFVGPNPQDDPFIYNRFLERVSIASCPWDQKLKQEDTKDNLGLLGQFNYQTFLEILQVGMEPIREIATVVPQFGGNKKEIDILDGAYPGFRQWFDDEVPRMRLHINEALKSQEGSIIHIDMGDCLSTLYYAYYCSLRNLSYVMTFHNPLQPDVIDDDHPAVSFAIGGHSPFAKLRPLLRRHMAVAALKQAERVFVSHDGIGAALSTLFPQYPIVYHADPLSNPSAADLKELPSGVEE